VDNLCRLLHENKSLKIL
jgi:hypothetical protein